MKRNLLYHVYPIRDSLWTWHAERLARHAGAFNGHKVLSIFTDARTVTAEEAQAGFEPVGFDAVLLRVNDPLGETAVFPKLLTCIQSLDPNEITFYAHAKGVTRTYEERRNIMAWCDAMYELCLGKPDVIDRIMSRYDTAGCFRLEMQHAGSPWHFSGTYFWLRHSALFARDWRAIQPSRHGVEGYPGRHFPIQRSFSFTPPEAPRGLYSFPIPAEYAMMWLKGLEEGTRNWTAAAL